MTGHVSYPPSVYHAGPPRVSRQADPMGRLSEDPVRRAVFLAQAERLRAYAEAMGRANMVAHVAAFAAGAETGGTANIFAVGGGRDPIERYARAPLTARTAADGTLEALDSPNPWKPRPVKETRPAGGDGRVSGVPPHLLDDRYRAGKRAWGAVYGAAPSAAWWQGFCAMVLDRQSVSETAAGLDLIDNGRGRALVRAVARALLAASAGADVGVISVHEMASRILKKSKNPAKTRGESR